MIYIFWGPITGWILFEKAHQFMQFVSLFFFCPYSLCISHSHTTSLSSFIKCFFQFVCTVAEYISPQGLMARKFCFLSFINVVLCSHPSSIALCSHWMVAPQEWMTEFSPNVMCEGAVKGCTNNWIFSKNMVSQVIFHKHCQTKRS